MTITNIIIAWLFVMIGYLLWCKFRDDKLRRRNFFNFGDFNFLVAAMTTLILVWFSFSLISPEPHFENPDRQIEFGNKTRQPWLVTDALWKKLQQDSDNSDYHFGLVENHFIQEKDPFTIPDLPVYKKEGLHIFNFFTELSEKEDNSKKSDLGNLMLAHWYLEQSDGDYEPAAFYLRQVKNNKLKYFNYLQGIILLNQAGPTAAEPYFLEELKCNGYRNGAYHGLADVYNLTGRKEELKQLIYNPASREAISVNYRYKVYFLNGDLFSFYELRFQKMLDTLPIWGFLGNFLILFMWLFFLRRLSFLSPIKWKHFFLAVGIGAILAMCSWLLYEFYHHILNFWTNGNIVNDLLFSFFGIGFIEELVKLIPFLLLLHLTKIIKKPIDYLLIASAAGLGFAFFENLLYISQYGLDVIHSRALTASVSHMVSSSIVAYGFVLVKFRYQRKFWIIPLFFILAVLAHGFYDFWLLNDKVHSLAIVTLFFFLSEVLIYVSFLNNSLNQSTGENSSMKNLSLNTQRLAGFLAGSFILVFVLEYIGTCLVYGTIIGNKTLVSAFLSGGYLIFFLSVRLSNIDIIPGEWMKIEFFSGILPSEFLGVRKKLNQNSVVGLTLTFLLDESSGSIENQLPFTGCVKRRHSFAGYSGWFEVELENSLLATDREVKTIFIRTKERDELIAQDEETCVGVFLISEDVENGSPLFYDWAVVK